jgi:hypothetical protein
VLPGKVFNLTLRLDQLAESYRAMGEHRAIKSLLRAYAWQITYDVPRLEDGV